MALNLVAVKNSSDSDREHPIKVQKNIQTHNIIIFHIDSALYVIH